MFFRTVFRRLMVCALPAALLWGQAGTPAKIPDFPVVLEQNVTAGKTPVGSKIQAKLTLATLLNGTVIPRNATLSGEVTESAARTASDPSRLAIRMDRVEWKSGTSAIKLYFTGWYYPTVDREGQDLQYGPPQPATRTWNGQGQYPDSNSHIYRPFPGSDSAKDSPVPDTPSPTTGSNSAAMKDVEARRTSDGTIVLTSKRTNVKLARYTTYVVSTGDTVPEK
jgi:hypothetical protein